jgi:hypothetical protein
MRAPHPDDISVELGRIHLTSWKFIRTCPRADTCSVNRCPLDPLIEYRAVDPLDRERLCTVSKADRERCVSRMTPEMQALLPFGGLLETEWNRRDAAKRRYDAKSPEAKSAWAEAGKRGLATLKEHRRSGLSGLTELREGSDPPERESSSQTR